VFLYAVKCIKSNTFDSFNAFPHEVNAMRAIANSAVNPQSQLCVYPHDYELWHMADINTHTGEVTPNLKCVMSVFNLKEMRHNADKNQTFEG